MTAITLAIGATVGNYRVSQKLPNRNNHNYWEITCRTCGAVKPARASHLRNGSIEDCCPAGGEVPTSPATTAPAPAPVAAAPVAAAPTAAPTAAPAPTTTRASALTNEHLTSLYRALQDRLTTAERTIEAMQFQLSHLDVALSPEGRAAWAENLRWHSLSVHEQVRETELEDAKKREQQAAAQVERRQQSLIRREQELESLKINLERIHALTATPFAERTPELLKELTERIHVEVLDIDKHVHEMERCAARRDTLLPAYQAVKDWNHNIEEMMK